MTNKQRLTLLPLCLLMLTGCDTVRDTLGLEHSGPNEFDVATSAPLSMPPDYNLRPPEPGAPRPQEVSASDQAQNLLLGNAAPKASGAPLVVSGGESALLQQAGAGASASVKSAPLPAASKQTAQQQHLEKVLFGKPAGDAASAPAIELEERGGWF
jgi:hypothetical protein